MMAHRIEVYEVQLQPIAGAMNLSASDVTLLDLPSVLYDAAVQHSINPN